MRPRSTPSPVSTSMASVTMPNGPHSHQWSTARDVDGDRQQRAQPVGVEAAVEQLDLLRLARQHVHQPHPGRVGVLQVGDLVGEHHRVAAPVAVEQRDRRVGASAASTDAAIESIGVMPEPAAISTWWPRCRQVRGERCRSAACTSTTSPGRTLVHQPARDRAAGDLAHADARRRGRPARRSSTTAARRRGGRSATGRARTRTSSRKLGGHVEGDRGRVVGQRGRPARPAAGGRSGALIRSP